MPARNMGSPVVLDANPSSGKFVIMSPFSGPSGSLMDVDQTGNASTGALNTGIGIGPAVVIGAPADPNVKNAGFSEGLSPGITLPDGTASETAELTLIGGGRSSAVTNSLSTTNPFMAQPILGFGSGTERDAGVGPVFTGHAIAMVTASSDTPDNDALTEDYVNRSGRTVLADQSTFGSDTRASPIVDEVPVEGVSLLPATDSITDVETVQLTWTFTPADPTIQDVTFESDHPEFATVDSSGLVTGVAAGVAVITITTVDGGHTDTSTITVTAA